MESIMPIRTANAVWQGDLKRGSGHMGLGSGAFEGAYDFRSRMENGKGTNPEELLGAAHAGCYSMALAHQLSQAGFTVDRIDTVAKVHFDQNEQGWSISAIDLETEAAVPGISPEAFARQAQTAKTDCPISKALASVRIRLVARLATGAHEAPAGKSKA
jgi:osmotically inducible protein OsmC